ncbi:MAG: hypothetical protein Fur005_43640 [Roseiflexaceae bacterium]
MQPAIRMPVIVMPTTGSAHPLERILIVDDEVAIAEFVAEILGDEGYQVRIWHDGASALVDILREPPDLIVLDIAMPVMGGDELLRRIRQQGQTVPVIVMTAGTNPERFIQDGATAILPKPFELELLLNSVRACLGTAKAKLHHS